MTIEKINYLYKDFKKALKRLEEAVNENPEKGSIVIDGTIQRFEFTFELSWKLAKAILNFKGVDCSSPRDTIKEAFQKKVIQNGDAWIEMQIDRNKTSHLYDEKEAAAINLKIKNNYYHLFVQFEKYVSTVISDETV